MSTTQNPPVLGGVAGLPPQASPAAPPRAPGLWRGARRRPPAYLVLPAVLVAGAMVLPLSYLVVRAAGTGGRAVDIVLAPATARVLADSALLAVLVTGASIALAVPLAWLVTRTDLPGRRTWSLLVALPLVVPTYVGGFAFVAALGPRGLVQSLLAPLGVQRLPELYGLPGAVLVLVLFSYPYLLLTVRGALLGMDPAQEEASRSLGRGSAETFRRVTLPQLRPAIGAGALLVALYALSDFGAVSLLRFDSFTRVIYEQYRGAFDRAPAAVLALVLVALTVALLFVEARTRGRGRYHRVSGGAARPQAVVHLGAWRWPAVGLCATVVVLALGVPVVVTGYWLVRGVQSGAAFGVAGAAAWHSLQAAGLAALCAAAAALPIAILGVRHRSRPVAALDRATYLGYALPGIVIALALVFFGAGGPLYQTLALLVFAYVVRFLPQAVGATRASLLQVPPSLEEAARGLGRRGPAVLATVTAPLVRPGVLAGAALVFLTTMKELPATLLLAPTGYQTLATAIWNATEEAFFAAAAVPALLLLILTGIPLAVLQRRDLEMQ